METSSALPATEKLPHELMVEIFSRLPTLSVLRFKRLSKQWSNTLDEIYIRNLRLNDSILFFTVQYRGRDPTQKRQPLISIAHPGSNLHHAIPLGVPRCSLGLSNYQPDIMFEPSLTCNGLMCIVPVGGFSGGSILVCNPLRPEYITLPPCTDTDMGHFSVGLGFSSISKAYKIVCINYRISVNMVRGTMKVYALGAGKPWRVVHLNMNFEPKGRRGGLCVDGKIYWVVFGHRPDNKFHMLSFDVESEKMSIIENVPGLQSEKPDDNFQLVQLGSRDLSLVINHGSDVELWVLRNKDSSECEYVWHLRHIIQVPNYALPKNFGKMLAVSEFGGGILGIWFDNMIMSYDGKVAAVGPGPDMSAYKNMICWSVCGGYRPSLASLEKYGKFGGSWKGERFVDRNQKLCPPPNIQVPPSECSFVCKSPQLPLLLTTAHEYNPLPGHPTNQDHGPLGWSFLSKIKYLYNSWKG